MSQFFPSAFFRALASDGTPLNGAKIKFYLASTTTPQAVYTAPDLETSLGATVTSDSEGRFADIWLNPDIAYKAVLTTSADVEIDTIDPVNVADADVDLSTNEQTFTGDGTTVAFVLSNVDVSSAGNLLVYVDNVIQPISGSYTVSSDRTDTTVTFSSAPPSGAVIRMREFVIEGERGERGPATGITQTYSSTTTDADPGAGFFRFNSATISAVTQGYFDDAEHWGGSIAAWLSAFDDSTSTSTKGTLILTGIDTESAFAIFTVTGTVTDGVGYKKITLSHVASGGTFTNGDMFSIGFFRTGDIGATGAGGATFAATFGDGAATSFVITHNLNSRNVQTVIYRNSSPYDVLFADVENTDANSITIRTTLGTPTLDQFAVAVLRTS